VIYIVLLSHAVLHTALLLVLVCAIGSSTAEDDCGCGKECGKLQSGRRLRPYSDDACKDARDEQLGTVSSMDAAAAYSSCLSTLYTAKSSQHSKQLLLACTHTSHRMAVSKS
jgi:hypothetical protein